jgi:excisionase family DNA binding protein
MSTATPGTDTTKSVFTTGEAADICKVSQQTIIRCFDAGRLKGFRVPGSKFRRIPRDALVAFMRDNAIPLENLHAAGGRTRILVVDDDPEIVELFVDVLDRDGRFEVQTAATGYAAGLLTSEFRPDLILLDYMLPDINGNVVCRTVKDKPELANTKIVIISGVAEQEEIDDLAAAGADDFVKKPFDIEQLIVRISNLLQLA